MVTLASASKPSKALPEKTIPESVLRRAQDKARRFPSPDGDRVNVWAIVLRYRVSPMTVYNRTSKAGVNPVEMPYTVGDGWNGNKEARTTATWLESEIDATFASKVVEHGTPGDPYVSKAEVHRQCGIASRTLDGLVNRELVRTIGVATGGVVYCLGDCRAYKRPTGPKCDIEPFSGIYAVTIDGNITEAFNLRIASKRYRIPLNTLNQYTDEKAKACPYFPGGVLPWVARVPPAPYGGSAEKTVLKEDMEKLVSARKEARCKPSQLTPDDGLATVREIADHHGVTKRWDYAQLGVLLCRLSASGQLIRIKTRRFSKRRRGCYRPFGYDLEAFNRLLSGRKLSDVLAEITPPYATGDDVVLRNGHIDFVGRDEGRDNRTPDQMPGRGASESSSAPAPNPAGARNSRGVKPKAVTRMIEEYCYRRTRIDGQNPKKVVSEVREKYDGKGPTSPRAVRRYADLHEERLEGKALSDQKGTN